MAQNHPASLSEAPSTEEIIAQIRNGKREEQEGYRTIFDRTTPHIWRVIKRTVKNIDQDEIADIAASTWKAVWRQIDSFDPERAPFRTWVSTIAHNKAVDYIRKTEAQPSVSSLDKPTLGYTPSEGLASDTRTPLEELSNKELQIAALDALMELPAFDRTLYLLYLNFDLTHADLAEIASRAQGKPMTEKAVQNRIYRTRAKLLDALTAQGAID
jgi:RNA polymerase sigma-70 factor (ECF subfamily)